MWIATKTEQQRGPAGLRNLPYSIREASPGDREAAFTLLSPIRGEPFARVGAACCDLHGQWIDDAQVLHCWVASDPRGELTGLAVATEAIGAVGLAELAVDPGWRGRGVGAALLCRVLDLADTYGVPILAPVRLSDHAGLSWLCGRDFEPGRWDSGSVAIRPAHFGGDRMCEEAVVLVRRAAGGQVVRIAE